MYLKLQTVTKCLYLITIIQKTCLLSRGAPAAELQCCTVCEYPLAAAAGDSPIKFTFFDEVYVADLAAAIVTLAPAALLAQLERVRGQELVLLRCSHGRCLQLLHLEI